MECPNCGNIMNDNDEICSNCKFNFNETISCPYLISKRCVHSNNICTAYGLDFEDCRTYLKNAGILN